MSFSKYNDHTSPLFKDLCILKFTDVIYYLNCIFLYKYHHNQLPAAFNNLFTPVSSRHKYETRAASKNSYCIPSIKTNYGKFNIRYRGASLWNDLDNSLKQTTSLHKFKSTIKNNLIASN